MPPAGRKTGEMKYYGRNCCHALFKARPEDVIRVYVSEGLLKEFAALLKWCAGQKKAYHVVQNAELERIAASTHHEGIVILGREPARLDDAGVLAAVAAAKAPRDLMLFLDGVNNPHNLGSLLRTAAHFGVSFLLADAATMPALSPSALRVAEGGIEHVKVGALSDPMASLQSLAAAGYRVVGTAGSAGVGLYDAKLPEKCVLVLGNEIRGMSDALATRADLTVQIPGAGTVESLNVGVAGGVVLGEWWRQHRGRA